MLRRLTILAAAIAIIPTASAAPAPYSWTPAQASAQLVTWNPQVWVDPVAPSYEVAIRSARCGGSGPAVRGRYLSFRCVATFQSRSARGTPHALVLFVKVRRQGTGQPCVSLKSLGAIPAGCLRTVGARVPGSIREARGEVRKRTGSVMSPECAGYGAGFYLCTYEIADQPGRAAVSFAPTKVSVTLL